MYVNIALNIPADKIFTYAVPENLKTKAMIGKRAYIPFGRRKRTGFITAVTSTCDLEEVKPITEILDDEPLFDDKDLEFFPGFPDIASILWGKLWPSWFPQDLRKRLSMDSAPARTCRSGTFQITGKASGFSSFPSSGNRAWKSDQKH